jgi:hypothetical protein
MDDMQKQQSRMTRLTKQYLAVLATAIGGGYVVTVHETGAGVWAVAIQFDGQESQQIATSRGELKVWRNLIGAIGFVQENCAAASEVVIEVGGWRFASMPTQQG